MLFAAADASAQTTASGLPALYDFALANGHVIVEALLLATIGTSRAASRPLWLTPPPVFLVLQRSYTPTKKPLTEKARSRGQRGTAPLSHVACRCSGDRHPLRRVAPRAAGAGAHTRPARRRVARGGHRVRPPAASVVVPGADVGLCPARSGAKCSSPPARRCLTLSPSTSWAWRATRTCRQAPQFEPLWDSPSRGEPRRRAPPPSRSTASGRAARAGSTAP